MKIVYPYNEILPKKKAHDLFIFQECAAFANLGWDTTLLCGKGSLPDASLFSHYETKAQFRIQRLPILRKNTFLKLSWNLPFFWNCQRFIEQKRPETVILSVRKQGHYHLKRKVPGVRYIYEIHELSWYPGNSATAEVIAEKEMLQRADLITVTTQALKEILLAPPYQLTNPIEVIPLAVGKSPLPLPPFEEELILMYIGQLYEGQGIPLLLKALAKAQGIRLKIVGGKSEEIAALKHMAKTLGIEHRVNFLGFCPPAQLSSLVLQAHACVAPFEEVGRMPYVAHTKLLEYAEWQRPFIAPQLPIVEEHFPPGKGVLLFKPGDVADLARALQLMQNRDTWETLSQEIKLHHRQFNWQTRAEHYKQFIDAHR